MAVLDHLASQHSTGFVITALLICLVAGWLLAVLLRAAEASQGSARRRWQLGVALVAGLGVWTTHFIAMLGYRIDLLLAYDGTRTALSALTSVAAVGIPLALSVHFNSFRSRLLLGALGGAGVGAMHFAGMSAIEGCTQTIGLPMVALACLWGSTAFALARGLPHRWRRPPLVCLLVTLGVCGVHFLSIAGVTVVPTVEAPAGVGENVTLSIFTAASAAVLFLGAMLALATARRFEAERDAHTLILSIALQNMTNGLVFIDGQNRIGLFNARFLEQFGLPERRLAIGMPISNLLRIVAEANGWSAAEETANGQSIAERLQSGALKRTDITMADGRILEIESRPVQGGGTVLIFDDVTVSRRAQQQISHLASHDPLTGLANRHGLQARMKAGMGPAERHHLLLLDLDRFRAINDTYGHAAGDELLTQVASRLRLVLSENDFIARIGGDEIAILLHGGTDTACETAEGLVSTLAVPFMIGDVILTLGVSIGLCRGDEATDGDHLMQQAEVALYEAKRQGGGRAVRYRAGMMEAVSERNQLERDIQRALARREFHLAYQPLVSLEDNSVIGYEALIRWDHPRLGPISPARFIPLAEESGLIVSIGEWVLAEACREAATWDDGLHVSVNVSPVQLRSPLIMAHVINALTASGLTPARLEIELTETAMVEDGPGIAHMLSSFRAMGIRVAMDDFGTGFSSLAHLRDFPLDRIKIDRSFVSSAETESNSLAVLTAIVRLGHAMSIPVLAEGIETEAQLALLLDIGCDAGQGYLLGRPERRVLDQSKKAMA